MSRLIKCSVPAMVLVVLSACAGNSPSPATAPAPADVGVSKEASVARAGGQAAVPSPAKLMPEETLARLVELIRTSDSVSDFTPDKLKSTFEVDELWVGDEANYGYSAPVTKNAWQSVQVIHRDRFRFDFSLQPNVPREREDQEALEASGLDFDVFVEKLKAVGFSGRPYYAEHGRFFSYILHKGRMEVWVYPRGASDPHSPRKYVWMVTVESPGVK